MNTNKLQKLMKVVLEKRRINRCHFTLSKVNINKKNMKVIDIGCGPNGRSFEDYIPDEWHITGVDIIEPKNILHKHPNFKYIKMNAQDLCQFKDKEFDLAISIGMLEHITEENIFNKIVSELMRVARQYIVIVPFKYGWIEPHFGIPFFPIFPYYLKLFLVKLMNLSNLKENVKNDHEYLRKHYRWLSNSEYKKIFPDAKIYLLGTLETIAIIKSEENFSTKRSK